MLRICAALLCLLLAMPAAAQPLVPEFNDKVIPWQALDEGLIEAKRTNKPVLVVIYADWCPACREYSKLFYNRQIEKMSSDFVFVLIDIDREKDAEKFGLDGEYVPQTYFLTPDGEIRKALNSGRDGARYFVNPNRAAPLVRLMKRAQKSPITD
jgi:thiol:disulfide interchange protein